MTRPPPRGSWRSRLLRHLPTVLAVTPLVVAAGRALRGHWYPVGDNAFFALRARDVLTTHHPWLGTWTSASLTVGTRINNPGPLLFDWLALPAKVDVAAGTVLGVVALHVGSVLLAVYWARRVADATGAWVVAAAFLALEWAMGSEILVEPWQPHSLLLPFMGFLVLVWALVAGQPWALPWAAGVASLIVETHLSYAVLVPGLAVLGVGALVASTARTSGWARTWELLRRPVVVGLAVLALAWVQPGFDQVAGEQNLGTVLTHGAGGTELAGAGFAARVVSSVGAVPGGWGPGGFEGLDVYLRPGPTGHEQGSFPGLASEQAAVLWGMAAIGVIGLAVLLTQRRQDRAWGSALVVAVTALVLTFASVALLPVSRVLGVAAHQLRPVWPVVIFTTVVTVAALDRALRSVERILPVAAVALLIVAVPAHNPRTGPSADAWSIPIVRDLIGQLDGLDGTTGVVDVDLSVIRFAEPYSTPVLLDLQRRGVEFVVDPVSAAQYGLSRAHRDDEPVSLRLRVVDGDAALDPAPGWTRLAFVAGLDPPEQEELDALDDRVASGRALTVGEDARQRELTHRRFFESAAVLVRPA